MTGIAPDRDPAVTGVAEEVARAYERGVADGRDALEGEMDEKLAALRAEYEADIERSVDALQRVRTQLEEIVTDYSRATGSVTTMPDSHELRLQALLDLMEEN